MRAPCGQELHRLGFGVGEVLPATAIPRDASKYGVRQSGSAPPPFRLGEIDRLEKVEREEKPEILYRELMIYPGLLALVLMTVLLWRRYRGEQI